MPNEFGYPDTGDEIEAKITDDDWIEGLVIGTTETRVHVRFLVPIVLIEKVVTVTNHFFGLIKTTNISEKTTLVHTMYLGIQLVRLKKP